MVEANFRPKTRKARSTAAVRLSEQVRNRDNQRRLRARRKDYTEELETKLRALERTGIHATEVMQKAARAVLVENMMLRDLLHSYGVSSTAVDAFLKDNAPQNNTSPQNEQRAQLESLLLPPLPSTMSFEQAQYDCLDKMNPSKSHTKVVTAEEDQATTASPLRLGKDETTEDVSTPVPANVWDCSTRSRAVVTSRSGLTASKPTVSLQQPRAKTDYDEMDCEEAAHIISSLRGGQDPEDIWPELSCSRTKKTTVKNAHVMSLAG